MSLSQLRAFVTAARAGSFTAAAAELGVAQASVSELIRRLEEDYAVTLFRRGRRLALTPAGTELLPFAERSVSAAGWRRSACCATPTTIACPTSSTCSTNVTPTSRSASWE